MKKTRIVLLAAGIFLLTGCGNKEIKEQANDRAQTQQKEKAESGAITSIKEAMGLGKTMKCVYKIKNEGGEMEAVSYVDGKKYKTEMTIAGKKQNMVFNEEAMYSWSEGEKQGTKMTLACSEELAKNAPKNETVDEEEKSVPDPIDGEVFDDALDVKCEEVGKIDFSIPTDINFVDQCEMMKNLLKNVPADMPDMPKNLPQGMPENIPNMPEFIQ